MMSCGQVAPPGVYSSIIPFLPKNQDLGFCASHPRALLGDLPPILTVSALPKKKKENNCAKLEQRGRIAQDSPSM